MNSILKNYIILLSTSIYFICMGCNQLSNSNCEKKYDRKEVQENFRQHEKDFSDIVEYFNSIIPKEGKKKITFGLGNKKECVDLSIYPLEGSISEENPILGGKDLLLSSPQLDSVLMKLHWTSKNVEDLRDKLSIINCEWIRNTETYKHPIEIFFKKSGWGSFSYYIFERPLTDSLIQIYGEPVNKTGFGSRVVISYSSAL